MNKIKSDYDELQRRYKIKEEEIEKIRKHSRFKIKEVINDNKTLCNEINKLKELNLSVSKSKVSVIEENNNRLQKRNDQLELDLKNKEDDIFTIKNDLLQRDKEINILKDKIEINNAIDKKYTGDILNDTKDIQIGLLNEENKNLNEIIK